MSVAIVRGWSSLGDAIRKRIDAWIHRRLGEDRLPTTLGARRLYILPTRAGLAFATLLLVMLLGGLNYSNSLALFITFMLAGFAFIAMHLTHRNLSGLVLRGLATTDAFVGEHGGVSVTLENNGDSPRLFIECDGENIPRASVDLPASGEARVDLRVPLERRGPLRLGRLRLSTSFPFGLFRAWTWVQVPARILAWPAPQGRIAPPAEAASGGTASALHRAGDEEWSSLREFRSGDSPRQVAWAAYARGRGLLVKTYQSPSALHRVFDLESLRTGNVEQKLEQISSWIVASHARGERYGLRLGESEIPPSSGREHRAQCLDALALYGHSGSA